LGKKWRKKTLNDPTGFEREGGDFKHWLFLFVELKKKTFQTEVSVL
jgi:hypothetical protein